MEDLVVVNVNELTDMANPHGVSARKVHESPHAVIVHIDLKPGEKLHRHITPVDVCFYVLAGRGVIEIGDQQVSVGPNSLVESPARVPHRLLNDSQENFRVLVIKTPRPAEPTRIL